MRKSILYLSLIISTFISACVSEKNTDSALAATADSTVTATLSDRAKPQPAAKTSALKTAVEALEDTCPDLEKTWSDIENMIYPEEEKADDEWIAGLDLVDSLQFQEANWLVPQCKFFENDDIIIVAFSDLDYFKKALHLFTFTKPELQPVSSFILKLTGGDGEDFWSIEPTRLGPLKFRVAEEFGYDNNAVRRYEFLIELRETREYTVDPRNGKLSRKVIKSEKGLVEIRK